MKAISRNIIFIFLAFLISSESFSETKPAVIQLNHEFYANLLKSKALNRDILLNGMQGAIVQGRGYVESVDKMERYRRHYRITAIDNEALELNIRLFIFADNEEYLTLLKNGDSFDFKGQFVIFTPLNSRRDSYIFDIILEEGALSVR
ncbi:MAG: hypothetical protein JXN64_07780 [Spirochaetes bacterium]|nr:hypothetical protein [Spirochaetota bacterium]